MIEEAGDALDRPIRLLVRLCPGLDHFHVEVDDLVAQPVEARGCVNIFDSDLDLVSVDQSFSATTHCLSSGSGNFPALINRTLSGCMEYFPS